MPSQFSKQAANADKLEEDKTASDTPERLPRAADTGDTPGGHAGHAVESDSEPSQPKPGKDINAPGSVKDKESSKP
jgi:hypothetical protein